MDNRQFASRKVVNGNKWHLNVKDRGKREIGANVCQDRATGGRLEGKFVAKYYHIAHIRLRFSIYSFNSRMMSKSIFWNTD